MDADVEMAETEGRVTKRQKVSNGHIKTTRQPGTSRLFAPYRTIGLVSPTTIPFTSVPLGKTTFQITTSIGRSLQTYDLRKGLNLVFITRPQTPAQITASVAWKDKVYGAWSQGGGDGDTAEAEAEAEARGRGVWVFKRGKKVAELEVPAGWRQDILCFCCFGGWMIGVCHTTLLVWKTTTNELYTTLQGVSPVPFTRCISTLPTFLNKLIVGREDGSAEIWNVSSAKLVYTILPPSTAYGAVTAIEPTPALSLVAIAYAAGPLLVHDIRADVTVMHLNSSSAGLPITSITFRTDGLGAGEDGQLSGVMATASAQSGDITLWDLNNNGRKTGVLRSAHADPTSDVPGGITRIEFLPSQHTLISSGADNTLKSWIFDTVPFSPLPRILHSRGGHGAPVTNLSFLPTSSDGADDTGKWLMSASQDRSFWAWSLRRDNQSQEVSQGALTSKARKQGLLSGGSRDKLHDLKCPPIIAMACSLNRDGGMGAVPGNHSIWQNPSKASTQKVDAEVSGMTGWESVLTAHANDNKARTWFWGRKRAGRWAFPTSDDSRVTSVAVDPSGTFALVGSERGGIDMFNLQSGIHRQRFPARLTAGQAKQLTSDLLKAGGKGFEEEKSADGRKVFYRGQGKHGAAVVGLAVDNLNRTLVSAGEDGRVKFWDFGTGLLRRQIDWSGAGVGIASMTFHRPADLAAFACTDCCVRVVDIGTYKVIRELWPSRPALPRLQTAGAPAHLAFSPDGHWIAASVSDIILVWDLPTGHLVDAFRLLSGCVGLGFSPTGEYLATAREGSVGVDVWSNRALFMHVATRLISAEELKKIAEADGATVGPTAGGEGGVVLVPVSAEDEDAEDEIDLDLDLDLETEVDIEALSSDLLTLSMVPRSRWQNLLHLDLIRARNKPIEPPTKPEKAPFFLPSMDQDRAILLGPERNSQQSTHNTDKTRRPTDTEATKEERTKVLTQKALARRSGVAAEEKDLSALLREAAASSNPDYIPIIAHLKSLPPAAADIALRSLSAANLPSHELVHPATTTSASANGESMVENGETELTTFIRTLTSLLHQHRDFELGQVWMSRFLALHGDLVVEDEVLRDLLGEWREVSRGERERVGGMLGYVSGVVAWVGRGRV
ncbi:hypothetical protein LTR62_000603 [Meristemomyces frigidus]|uniref:Small-subunit processome Utp21 domain-containing protein n=1 Tax=Meristemomyces frigidus TaxID=1508187 RepID=A0AAN7T933_9PEZI|nr:hypothetical protein LTR62_000603 [Meristemomyces frigidus]